MNTIKESEFDYQSYTREHGPETSQIRPGPAAHKRRREVFKARLINHVNMQIKHARAMKHVFISYCHENKNDVNRLCEELTSYGVTVWMDTDKIDLNASWKQAIQQAIHQGGFFIACFSKEYTARDNSYMSEELSIAVDKLQQEPDNTDWFIPVKLNDCEIPDSDIGEGKTLRTLPCVDLHENWHSGIQQIQNIMPADSCETFSSIEKMEQDTTDCILLRSIEGEHYFIPFQEVRWDSKEIILTLSPNSTEHTAFLSSARKDQHNLLAFAHEEDSAWVKPKKVVQISNNGQTEWELTLIENMTGKSFKQTPEKNDFKLLTLDQIVNMRANRLLLDEKLETPIFSLTQATIFDQMLLENEVRGELSTQYENRLQALTSPIPKLYHYYRNTPATFLHFARLISVLYLKLSNTVDHILKLDFELLNSRELAVDFKGLCNQTYKNKDPILVKVEGICPLPK